MKRTLQGLAGAGVLLFSAAAMAGSIKSHPLKPRPIRQNTVIAAPSSGFGVMLKIDQLSYSVKPPATLHATLTLFNDTGKPFDFLEHGQGVGWQILDAQGNVVWDYAKGRMFPHFVLRRSLAQGKLDYAQDIPLITQDGAPLTAGHYWLRGRAIGARCAAEVAFAVTDAP